MTREAVTIYRTITLLMLLLSLGPISCQNAGEWARVRQQNESLLREKQRLVREVAQKDEAILRLHQQTENLKGFGPDRPADLFAPVKLDFASLTSGADFDGKPGDDGVIVYLRPRDADGDVVKVPGRITIQLLDNANLQSPQVLGVYMFNRPAQLRELWHGAFLTDHYTLKCPFPPGTKLPKNGRVTVSAEFLDYLSGATLTAVKEVTVRSENRS